MSKNRDEDAPAEAGPSEHVETPDPVELPTIGRIVHFRIDYGDEEVLRPALVLDVSPSGLPGDLAVQVFLRSSDVPFAPGTGLALFNGGYYATAAYGSECGQWRWPVYGEPSFFTVE